MAKLTSWKSVTAGCGGCGGAQSSFVLSDEHAVSHSMPGPRYKHFYLVQCPACQTGGLVITQTQGTLGSRLPPTLLDFYPESRLKSKLPPDTPHGIEQEFREGERCLDAKCYRAAAAMFRSVLDKTLRANGYKEKRGTNLGQQIDAAARDGAITGSRSQRAHNEIRVLGNDVLHEEWEEVTSDDVEAARHYAQRILEDFYDDRDSTVSLLKAKGRIPSEDMQPPAP